jgi:pimeloyl-ACP methyl ester carboxylesterase
LLQALRAGAVALALMFVIAPLSAATNKAPTLPLSDAGELDGSPYRFDIPAQWNGSLVLAAHGYLPEGAKLPAALPTYQFGALLLERGYAVATVGYRRQGWALAEAVQDTEALREEFVARYGKPKRTFMIGTSMGGLITVASQEQQAERYDGALALCGAVAPASEGVRDRILALLVAFDYLVPNQLTMPGQTLADPAAPSDVAEPRLARALAEHPDEADLLGRHFGIKPEDLAAHVRFYYVLLRELMAHSGGFPVDNRDQVYTGFGDDEAFNRGVRRYAADPDAAKYLRANYTPTGRIAHPLLLLHTSYDPTVPPQVAQRYLQLANAAGSEPLVVSRFAQADGHCNFSAKQVGGAFDALVGWVERGEKPAAGRQD